MKRKRASASIVPADCLATNSKPLTIFSSLRFPSFDQAVLGLGNIQRGCSLICCANYVAAAYTLSLNSLSPSPCDEPTEAGRLSPQEPRRIMRRKTSRNL